ncbi:Phototropic-responsive NPH3 family protein [Rhynchospora pubera]|uniref:Phototropic-responsive NPH3 family protein n=1 Tax=Rhynchospora pubera TaxID=906938 RepID=A0AAV8D551_9POAL|nr:Phototropic-responsive NPH3 family protein [Rhynchospora pubera]
MSGPSKPSSSGQAWFCTTGLPSDVVFEVRDMTFHLHKFPLMSKCGKIHRLLAEEDSSRNLPHVRNRPTRTDKKKKPIEVEEEESEIVEESDEQEEEAEQEEKTETEQKKAYHISLTDFPGGPGTFETAAKFCYGVKIELTSWNVVPLRCAAEYLEMTEELVEDNLISCTEKYLNQSVLRHLSEASKALKSCEDLLPFAEDLGLVQRCVDTIATRVSNSDPLVLFGWPVQESSSNTRTPSRPVMWNGLDTGIRRRGRPRSFTSADSWLDDVSFLSLPMYKRVIEAMIARGATSQAIEGSLVAYANRCIPGLSRLSRRHSSAPVVSEKEQRELLETVIGNLPLERSSGMATTKFLFGLLRTASILQVSEGSRTTLERKIGSQLEQATLYDLLIPNYSHVLEVLYDVDCIERIFKYFLVQAERSAESVSEEEQNGNTPLHVRTLNRVGKLLDSYLAEVASDVNLKPHKFCELALVLPDYARVYDDGIYRAVDIYLKAHGNLTGEEKERICGVVDCRKLTMEACTHAAQNERLPLRAVLQVLFFEQLQLRRAIAGTLVLPEQLQIPNRRPQSTRGREGEHLWQTTVRENQVLRLDMDSMRNRVHELERECSSMKKVIRQIDGGEGPHVRDRDKDKDKDTDGGSDTSSSRRRKGKFGCRFSTQVCDSHERKVVESKTTTKVELSP